MHKTNDRPILKHSISLAPSRLAIPTHTMYAYQSKWMNCSRSTVPLWEVVVISSIFSINYRSTRYHLLLCYEDDDRNCAENNTLNQLYAPVSLGDQDAVSVAVDMCIL